ncbi:MAG TPA: histidinol-phosphate transaminase [Chryseolinea sp.]|nr:histidinol-phosphate transaminase [Chryseolinea sp.]
MPVPNTPFDINVLVRENIRKMKPYSSARDEFSGEAEVFLDANENPYPTPFNRYPDPLQWNVKHALSPLKGVSPEQIFLGNGSDEAIDLLIRAFCEPNRDAILITEPTYGMYSVCANVNAVRIVSISLNGNFDIDLSAFSSLNDPALKIIFLCSPNNPSANLLNTDRIFQLLEQFAGLVVVDEAYIDFTSSPSLTQQLPNYPNLVILQTFSKAWGLAGLRLGMCFASQEIIAVLNKIKYPYNVNIRTQELALEALSNAQQKDDWVKEILKERGRLSDALLGLAITKKVYPSEANFILVKVADAPGTYKRLMALGIIVRDRSNVRLCDNCLRITVGTPRENDHLITALKQFNP